MDTAVLELAYGEGVARRKTPGYFSGRLPGYDAALAGGRGEPGGIGLHRAVERGLVVEAAFAVGAFLCVAVYSRVVSDSAYRLRTPLRPSQLRGGSSNQPEGGGDDQHPDLH